MNILKRICTVLTLVIAIFFLVSCKKQNEWLDKKSNKSTVVPETIKDYQAILDNVSQMNNLINSGLLGTDNIFIADNDVAGLFETDRNLLLWNKQIWSDGISGEWNTAYSAIGRANIVIDGMAKISSNGAAYNNVIGQAYFYRSIFYYSLAQIFCKPYRSDQAATDLGLPIRLSSDVTKLVQRSNLQQLYDQMIDDAQKAINLLSEVQTYNQRPSKLAAKALLTKIYFVQENYSKANALANEVLLLKNDLLDYNNPNQVSLNNAYRFLPNGVNNPEIMFFAKANTSAALQNFIGSVCYVASELYQMYSPTDLRRTMLYGKGTSGINFVGSYTGTFDNFSGLATNEIILIRAECLARAGDSDGAMSDINRLLLSRYKTGTFNNLIAENAETAIRIVLNERRKELPLMSQIRWEDLRRLNRDPRFEVTINRSVNGVTHTLPPNDPRYVLPIPEQEIQISGIEQNIR